MIPSQEYINKLKTAVGLSAAVFDEDITMIVSAAAAMLVAAGLVAERITETDPLVYIYMRQAVKQAYPEDEAEANRLQLSMDSLRAAMSLMSEYNMPSSGGDIDA